MHMHVEFQELLVKMQFLFHRQYSPWQNISVFTIHLEVLGLIPR